ncbi:MULTISPECIES: zinc transporter ZntB [Larsenimonas]|uniref:Zinc transporter ZntB n=1 Tax=Larsenimonas suaedae TaxID=1851019 RepID=A0ABU1GY94_9GAMM|nr:MULTISPECIES: zinc transporter ZntB [Larsenimonas]MCM2972990.1 zinc transporter ZntB [Larsenimonas suaedae]MCM5704945.1 zinc transporter ZntB [Larsenimonas salina]MDR5896427.1 zinc transporter ZntB [Larsenimonas suaedae]
MVDATTSLVAAYRLDGLGGGQLLEHDDLNRIWQTDPAPVWMHLDFTHGDAPHFLQDIADLHEDVIEALLEEQTRPRVGRFVGGLVTTLRGINLNPGAAPDDMISLRVWLTNNRLITLRRRPLQSISLVRNYLHDGEGPRNVSELLASMTDAMIDKVGELDHDLDDRLGQLEECQLNDELIDDDELLKLRRSLITLRRFMEPQCDCLNRLASEPGYVEETARLWLRESANQLQRYVEDTKAMQERSMMLQEQLNSERSEQLNDRMYVLSVITAIFLPLGFLTGLLGINVGGIPGADNHYGFTVFVGLIVLVILLQLWLLRRKRWF